MAPKTYNPMEIAAVLKPHFPLLTYPKFRAPKFMMYLVGPFVGAFVVACIQLQLALRNLSKLFLARLALFANRNLPVGLIQE